MVKDTDPSINENAFLLEALKQGKRVDGREVYDMRSIEITLGNDYGYAEVRLGKTKVAAHVTAEVVRPYTDRPSEGVLLFNTEISPMAAPTFDTSK
jgi:exosome complex component RRP45